jgi:3-deoxy-D-manno-octulosonic-acid transferase
VRSLYTLLWYLALPLVVLAGLRRARREQAAGVAGAALPARDYWRQRLGHIASAPTIPTTSATPASETLWVHAASVGEVQLAAVLINAVRAQRPGQGVLLTCHTATGRARARELLPDVPLHYAPYDLPAAVRRRLSQPRPRALVLMETELWPNLLAEADRARVPVLVASARLSARSVGAYRRLAGLLRPAIERDVWVGAQTPADAARFSALGVAAERLSVTGNLKFDRPLPIEARERGTALRALLGARPVWVAGSTHPAEQLIVLDAHRRLLAGRPEALLVLAPRHPPRFEEAAGQLEAGAWRYRRRSREPAAAPLPADCQVWLLDTLGELVDFYAAADIAFVGGSLVPVGGHNLLEPAALGLPLLAGPHQTNSPQIARVLGDAGALGIVGDAEQLAARLQALIDSPSRRQAQGERARAALDAHRGALERLLAIIETLPHSR